MRPRPRDRARAGPRAVLSLSNRRETTMRLIPFVLAAFILSIPGPAFAQEWIEFASREDRFTANFPGQPKIAETTWVSEYGAPLRARVYSGESGQSRYSITVVDYSPVERIL